MKDILSVGMADWTALILGLGVFYQWCGLLYFLSYFGKFNVSAFVSSGQEEEGELEVRRERGERQDGMKGQLEQSLDRDRETQWVCEGVPRVKGRGGEG